MPKPMKLSPEQIRTIERILEKGRNAEVKVEKGEPVIIQVERKKVNIETSEK